MDKAKTMCVVALICLVFGLLIFTGIDYCAGKEDYRLCTITAKEYQPPYTTQTWVTTGKSGGHFRTTKHPAKYLVYVIDPNNKRYTKEVAPHFYHAIEKGQEKNFRFVTGYFTGRVW